MTRKSRSEPTGYSILLVDDSPEYLEVTRALLERERHKVWVAASGPEALAILQAESVDLMLVDYFMPGMTGEQVVEELRKFNPYVQVILQTGYASEQPPRELLRRLDIQGYYDKTEGPEKLLIWTDVGLKAAYTVQMLNKSRQGLRYILDVTPDLHKIQPLEDLLQGILLQVSGLVGAVNSFLAVLPDGRNMRSGLVESEGFVAMMEDKDSDLVIRASTGRFAGSKAIEPLLDQERLGLVRNALQHGVIQKAETTTVVPLSVGESTFGVIYLDRPVVLQQDIELVHIFANQATVAIQNMQLYEMATLDPLTGACTRGFLEKWLLREVRTAFRSQQPLSLVMVDLDRMKQINDAAGHLAGDQALAIVAKGLRQATRNTDIVGRYGGDEFAVILSQSRADGAERVGERMRAFLQDKYVTAPTGPLSLQVSMGYTTLEPHAFRSAEIPHPIPETYFQNIAPVLIRHADEALYAAKKNKDGRIVPGKPTVWPLLEPRIA